MYDSNMAGAPEHSAHTGSVGRPRPLRPPCTRLMLVTTALLLTAATVVSNAGASRSAPVTVAARTLTFNINASLHLVGLSGHVLNEKGSFTGTQSGTIAVRFTSVNVVSGSATFAAYSSRGGSVSGRATIRGHVGVATVHFTGIVTITGGTGRWAHASGRNLRFAGTVDPHNFRASAHIEGSINV
jgi:hypothetical protein